MSKKQMGFTLIEIVMVLVLLDILSAVAVPKYFDLRDKAEQKTAQAFVAEVQARLNGAFAQALLDGDACKNPGADKEGARLKGIKEANKTTSDAFEFTTQLAEEDKGGLKTIAIKSKNSGVTYTFGTDAKATTYIPQISVPLCSKGDGTEE